MQYVLSDQLLEKILLRNQLGQRWPTDDNDETLFKLFFQYAYEHRKVHTHRIHLFSTKMCIQFANLICL